MLWNLLPADHNMTLACHLSVSQISGPTVERSVSQTRVSLSRLYLQRPFDHFTVSFHPGFLPDCCTNNELTAAEPPEHQVQSLLWFGIGPTSGQLEVQE
jgi:hypothetical protein